MRLRLDLQRFFESCDPSRTLVIENPQDRLYYIDFASVRGGKVIDELRLSNRKFNGDLALNKHTLE